MISLRAKSPDRSGRRAFLGRAAGLIAAGSTWREAIGDDRSLIVRNARPLDAETPVGAFGSWKTPTDLVFVRSHFGVPAVGLSPWSLSVSGLVDRPGRLSIEDLKGLPEITLPAVIQCSGNGRAFHRPIVPGVRWERGAVANAEWSGVRLRDLLERAGIGPKAAHVHLIGADGPPSPKTPAFLRSIPLDRALDPNTIIASKINGEALPTLHGGPLRLVVPGWAANHWMKWLREVRVSDAEAPGFYMQTAYKIPRVPGPPGVDPKPGDLVSVTALNVKSLIATPASDSRLDSGRTSIRGVAWTGMGKVVRVEVSVDDGPWVDASFEGPDLPFAWRSWRLEWAATPGRHSIAARATDSLGETQPEATPWNKSGYLWNAIDRVSCEVA